MPLRRQHLGHVHLDLLANLAAFVQAVDEEKRAARHHSLAQHAVVGPLGAVLDAEESIDPIPCRRKGFRMESVAPPALQQLHLDQDGNERTFEREHHQLGEQCRLAARRPCSEQ